MVQTHKDSVTVWNQLRLSDKFTIEHHLVLLDVVIIGDQGRPPIIFTIVKHTLLSVNAHPWNLYVRFKITYFFTDYIVADLHGVFEVARHLGILIDISDLGQVFEQLFFLNFGYIFRLLLSERFFPFLSFFLDFCHHFGLLLNLTFKLRISLTWWATSTCRSDSPSWLQFFNLFFKLSDQFILRRFINYRVVFNSFHLPSVSQRR